jgi:hypothetical protein
MKKKLSLFVVLLALVALGFTYQGGSRWEYKVESLSVSEDGLDSSALTGLGVQGWELVAVESNGRRRTYFFKRPK